MKLNAQSLTDIIITSFFLAICVVVRPAGLVVNNGFSYYGIYLATIIPYAAVFTSYSLLFINSAKKIRKYFGESFSVILYAIPIILVGIVVTPYDRFPLVHNVFATSPFLLQALLVMVFLYKRKDVLNYILTSLELVSGLCILYFFEKEHGYMMESQLLFQFVFSWMLLRFTSEYDHKHLSPNDSQ